MIVIHSDGACRGNQFEFNQGGWGCVFRDMESGKVMHKWGHEPNSTTNVRMELVAAIEALKAVRHRESTVVELYSDSEQLVKGMTEWLGGWKANSWRNSSRKPVKNADLWRTLDELSQHHTVRWLHVRGHNGDVGNEMADKLANDGASGKCGSKLLKSTSE
jgi:ribonuclease HI